MERNPGMRRASMPGITSPRTTLSYASALSLVVQPRHTRQIMNPESIGLSMPVMGCDGPGQRASRGRRRSGDRPATS